MSGIVRLISTHVNSRSITAGKTVGAAVESFRNVATEQNQQLQQNLLEAQKIVPAIVSAALNNNGMIEGSK